MRTVIGVPSSDGSTSAAAVLDLARISSITIELSQLDGYWRDQVAKGPRATGQPDDYMVALRSILDRMNELLVEFQTIAKRIGSKFDLGDEVVRANVSTFLVANQVVGIGSRNDLLFPAEVQEELLTKISEREPVDFDAAAAEAAAAIAAAAEAERQRLEALAAQIAGGGGGGGGDTSVVGGIASAITGNGLGSGLGGGSGSGAGGGHPFTVLGCLIGAGVGVPEFGCAAGIVIDIMLTAEGEHS